ncbi:MAG: hypothetical protein NTZ71_11330 [Planctomycetota bacterium]|nr:hypothetical protein [Planctomycetota bacterium]
MLIDKKIAHAFFLPSLIFALIGHADDSSNNSFEKSMDKIKIDLIREFDQSIEKLIMQGKLKELKVLENERKSFLLDNLSLPSSQSMIIARSKYESNWWLAKSLFEKDLKTSISNHVKLNDISSAEKTQSALDKIEKMKLIPRDVSVGLIGNWKIKMVGRTRQGTIVDYSPVWEFRQNNSIWSIDANMEGVWEYDYKNKRILISWNNQEKSKEAFFLPFSPNGMNGGSWHGAGVKLSAIKIIDKKE